MATFAPGSTCCGFTREAGRDFAQTRIAARWLQSERGENAQNPVWGSNEKRGRYKHDDQKSFASVC
jgi:hypothetical protein